ncbi:MAG: acyltransferase [Eubacterium sp.]|nr:acyltransferase [Eubacterium sp.]
MQSKRQANFELLRIVAMLMIIVLHYLNKSNLLLLYTQEHMAVNYVMHLIIAFCIVAVNCYVLLSGYFLVESAWKPGRVVSLVAQILFYSLLIPVVLICAGVVSAGDLTVYDWLGFVLPIETEHYWFATAYLIMYVFAPLVAAGAKAVEKKTLQIVIGILLLFFSVGKSLVPATFATDHYGYDYGWFLCLFLIAAYIRLHGCPKLEKRKNAWILYIGMSLGIFLLAEVSGILAEVLHPFAYYMDMPTTYNHILCLLASIGLFMAFKDMKSWEGKAADLFRRLAPYTFGVYLLHEHVLIRNQWIKWLRVDEVWGSWMFIPHMIVCVLIVYAAGTVVDYGRALIFRGVGRMIAQHKKRRGGDG